MKIFKMLTGITLSACMLFSGFASVPAEKTIISPTIEANATVTKEEGDRIVDRARKRLGQDYSGWCLKYVQDVYADAGFGGTRWADARTAGDNWIVDTSFDNIPIGAMIFFSYTEWGHVEIYTGNGCMIGSGSGTIQERPISNWWKQYYRGWGYGGLSAPYYYEEPTEPEPTEPEPHDNPPAHATSANIPDGKYYIQNVGTGQYLDYSYEWSSTVSSYLKAMITWEFDGSAEQTFNLVYIGDGQYKVYSDQDNAWLNCFVGSPNEIKKGVQITGYYEYDDNNTQKFYFTPDGDGTYLIQSVQNPDLIFGTYAYVGPKTGNTYTCVNLQYYHSNNANQKWRLIPLNPPKTSEEPTEEVTDAPIIAPTEPTEPTEEVTDAPIIAPTEPTEPSKTEEELTVEKTELSLNIGEQYTIKASQNNLTYQSSNPDVAVVSKKGVITALKEGYTVITVMNSDYDAVPIKVTVEADIPALLAGDADGSGEIDILDVITLNKATLGKETLSEAQLKAIDFNGNGKPDSSESLTILKYIVGMITSFTA